MQKGKKIRRMMTLLTAAALLMGLLSGCAQENETAAGTWADAQAAAAGSGNLGKERKHGTVTFPAEGTMEVQFLDVGQGDATLIQCGAEAMLIDAGNNDQADEVAGYLESRGITTLKYVIGTHPDADHIGGLDVVIEDFDCENVILPEIANDTKTYEDVIAAMEGKQLENTVPVVGDQYQLGEAVFTILAPNRMDYGSNTNDFSVGLMLQHGEKRFLFTGDAEEAAEADMLTNGISLKADVYKVAHHGSRSATTEEFLARVAPSDAVISCGEDNSYGHPHAEVLNRLRAAGVTVRRTDEEGTIVAVSDGSSIAWNVSGSESWQTGEQSRPDAESVMSDADAAETQTEVYILNRNTKKFHLPDCPGAEEIHTENREESSLSREELLAQGYEPCKRCRP
ncbi:MAG TPA: MBL fold metallo-hydrolase [Lachnospiraceae bacterium]|nr:MBL fold metallo-hydrolase [Lachnospiraceae bacterium]